MAGTAINFTSSIAKTFSEQGNDLLYEVPTEIIAILSIFYGGISLIAVFGNILVIWIVVTTKHMNTVTNMYIANLAFADVIIGIFCIPFQAALLQRWNLPKFMCAFCPFIQVISVSVSIFTLTAVAIDRYRAIIKPLRPRPSKSFSKGIILIIWIISTILAIPIIIAFRVIEIKEITSGNINEKRLFCENVNLSDNQLLLYRDCLVLFQYILPLGVISFVYIRMAVKLWGSKIPGNTQNSRDVAILKKKKKVIKMLIIVVLIFGICWLPLQFYNILYVTLPEINEYHFINIIWFCCDILAMSNSCYNPFIYGIYNERFQQEFKKRFNALFFGKKYQETNEKHSTSIMTRISLVQSNFTNSFKRGRLSSVRKGSGSNLNESPLKLFNKSKSVLEVDRLMEKDVFPLEKEKCLMLPKNQKVKFLRNERTDRNSF